MRQRLPMIFSVTALVVAVLGSTPLGHAALNVLAPGSVGTSQLKDQAVIASKLANGSVTGAKLRGDAVDSGKVRNGSLKSIDFAAGQIPAGPAGPKGDKGSKGDSAATTVVVRRHTTPLAAGGAANFSVSCSAGEHAIAGGAGITGQASNSAVTVTDSKPLPTDEGATPTGWTAGLTTKIATEIAVYVICAKP